MRLEVAQIWILLDTQVVEPMIVQQMRGLLTWLNVVRVK